MSVKGRREQMPVHMSYCVCVRVCVCAVASVVSTSVWPHGRQPAILLCPWILQATILEGVAVSLSVSCIGRQVLYLCVVPTSQNPSLWNPSWLSNASTARKDPESEWVVRDNLETNPITVKAKTVSQVAEQFSWVPLSCCSPPGHLFPVSSLTLSAPVSPWNICAWVLDKSPVLGHGRVSLFMQW